MRVMKTLGLLLVTLALTCAGCADEPEPEEARMSVETSRTRVQAEVKDVAELLATAGHQLPEATGEWEVCSADPPQLKYSAGGLVTSPDAASITDAVAAIAEVLKGNGWAVETEGTDPEPYANLEKDGLFVALGESRRAPGSVSLGVKDECVATTSEQDSLLGEVDQILG